MATEVVDDVRWLLESFPKKRRDPKRDRYGLAGRSLMGGTGLPRVDLSSPPSEGPGGGGFVSAGQQPSTRKRLRISTPQALPSSGPLGGSVLSLGARSASSAPSDSCRTVFTPPGCGGGGTRL